MSDDKPLFEMKGYSVIDRKGREVIKIDDNTGKLLIARFEDMSLEEKKKIIWLWIQCPTVDSNEEELKKLINFLNFHDEEERFCS
jgi:hypothetical protein